MNLNLVNKSVLNGLNYKGPSMKRDSKLLQGEGGGIFKGALSDLFKTPDDESNFKIDVVLTNDSLIKLGVLVTLAIILNKKL